MENKVYMMPNPLMPNNPIEFDAQICNGCNRCIEACRTDVLMPNPVKGKTPIVLYPDECWCCACCVQECKRPGAIQMLHPLNQSIAVNWKRKATGEHFRIGSPNPPPPNTKPPLGRE